MNRLSFRLPRRSMKTKLFLYMLVPVILILVLLASCLSLFDRFKTPKDTLAERLDMLLSLIHISEPTRQLL